jgi:hypothetical protein
MRTRRQLAATFLIGVLGLSGCSAHRENTAEDTTEPSATGLSPLTDPTTAPSTATTTPNSRPPETTTTTTPRRTTTTSSTTTTLVPVRSAHNPRCVVRIRPGDSLFVIAEAANKPRVTIVSLQRENRIRNPDRIDVGDLLDICVGNGINDINGRKRPARPR